MVETGPDLSSFGSLLKAFRKRKHLTQQQLADAIGVHRSAIIRWEQGDFLPEHKATVFELARHLHLDDRETRHLLEASLTALAPHWLVPLPRNPFFTGREEIMAALHAQLGAEQTVALTQSSALHGLGGVGKTQIALEYAYRHALEYSAVFWIGAETEESIVSDLLRIAEVLQLPRHDDKDQQHVIAAVQRWLSTHKQWLLIWDNVEDLALLDRFLPSTRSGAILLTTRRQMLGTLAWGLDLLPMEQEEGVLFLLRRAKVLFPEATSKQVRQLARQEPAQYAAAVELVTELGGLPLALDQAGAYLEETRCGLSAYLDLFRSQRAVLLRRRGEGARDHPASVSTTFTLAITATVRRHPVVWDLLCVCALLQPDAIPEEVFRQGSRHLGTSLEAVCRDKMEWDRVVGIASSYSLLSREPEEHVLSMHRLVQAVLLDAMTDEEQEQWNARVIAAFDMTLSEVRLTTEYAVWKQWARQLPHVLLCLHRVGRASESLSLASLAHKAARYLLRCGRHAEAEPLFRHALHIREQVLGPGHPDVAAPLNGLGILSTEQGKYTEAEPLLRRALQIWERTLGPEHPDVAFSFYNLASLSQEQGQYAEAERFVWQALQIWERTLGPEHPSVAASLNGLSILSTEQGKYTEAEPLLRRALQFWERTLGPEHPDVAASLNNLADLYWKQDRYTEAEPLMRRALQIWEQTLGPEHPFVAAALNGLANICQSQSRYPEAERLYQRALLLQEQYLGPQHPETAQTLHDMALFHQRQGYLNEAISLAERALHIRSQALGGNHQKTIAARTLYAQLLQQQATPAGKKARELRGEEASNLYQTEHLFA